MAACYSSTSQLSRLESDLTIICSEIRSNKVLIRVKALEKLDSLLNNRSADVCNLLSSKIISADITWRYLYESALESLHQHSLKLTEAQGKANQRSDSKNSLHIKVIQKILNVSNYQIHFQIILNSVMDILLNESLVNWFGNYFLQILEKSVVNLKTNLTSIDVSSWTHILDICFENANKCASSIQPFQMAKCLSSVLKSGLEYSHLASKIGPYLRMLRDLIVVSENGKYQSELFRSALILCQHGAVDYRFELLNFTETILGTVCKAYEPAMEKDEKTLIFNILHLSIVLHEPTKTNHNFTTTEEYFKLSEAESRDEWNKHIRNIFFLVGKEIKYLSNKFFSLKSDFEIVEEFFLLAVRICRVVLWDETIWMDNSGETITKLPKRSNKIQSLIEYVETSSGKHCFVWFTVLSEFVIKFPNLIGIHDLQPIVLLLSNVQTNIQYAYQVKVFTRFCRAMLQIEYRLRQTSDNDKCLWQKIIERSFRSATSHHTTSNENHILLQLLIKFDKIPSKAFVQTVMQAYLSESIRKTRISVETICTMFECYNTKALENVESLMKQTLDWLYPKQFDSRSIMSVSSVETPRVEMITRIAVMCCLKRNVRKIAPHENSFDERTNTNTSLFTKKLNEIEKRILFQNFDELLLPSLCERSLKKEAISNGQQVSTSNVINDTIFEYFITLIKFDYEQNANEHEYDCLRHLLSTAEVCLHVLSHLIKYNAISDETILKCSFTKRLNLKLQAIELFFSSKTCPNFDECDSIEIIDSLLTLFNPNVDCMLANVVRANTFAATLTWVASQTSIVTDGDIATTNCTHFELKSYEKSTKAERKRLNAIKLICICSDMNITIDEQKAFTFVEDINFNIEEANDLFLVLKIVEWFIEQKPTTATTEWIVNNVMAVCKMYHHNQEISLTLIKLIGGLATILCRTESVTDNFQIMIKSFKLKCKKSIYAPDVTYHFVRQLKYLIKAYPHAVDEPSFTNIYEAVILFLNSPFFIINEAVVDCLAHIWSTEWVLGDNTLTQSSQFFNFQQNIFGQINFTEFIVDGATKDVDKNAQCFSFNVLAAIICVNNVFLNKAVFILLELIDKTAMVRENVLKLKQGIEQYRNDECIFSDDLLLYCLEKWIAREYPINKFPHLLFDNAEQSVFVERKAHLMTLAALKSNIELVNEIAAMSKRTHLQLINDVIPDCIVFLYPLYASAADCTTEYRRHGAQLHKYLESMDLNYAGQFSSKFSNVLEKLFLNTWDAAAFLNLFNFRIDFHEETFLSVECLDKCLVQLKKNALLAETEPLISFVCNNKPFAIIQILISIKLKIDSSKAIEHNLRNLFQLSILITHLTTYLVNADVSSINLHQQNTSNYKSFFLRSILLNLCHLLNHKYSKVRIVALKILSNLCKNILPICNVEFSSCTTFVVATLLELVQNSSRADNTNLRSDTLSVLKLIVVENKHVLSESIALLDNFPEANNFEELRSSQTLEKYRSEMFTLKQEIVHFMKVEKRTKDGLIALNRLLSSRKEELSEMYLELSELNGFSKDCENSVLHKLLFCLLRAVRSNDTELNLEAVKCLGELGISDLTTMILKSNANNHIYTLISSYEGAMDNLVLNALTKMNTLLLTEHNNTKTVNTIALALRHLFQYSIAKKYLSRFPYLQVFACSRKLETVPFEINSANQLNYVQMFERFKNETHNRWLQEFVFEIFCLLDDEHLGAVARENVNFSETMLPMLVTLIFHGTNAAHIEDFQSGVASFFAIHCLETDENNDTIYVNKQIVKTMLNVVESIRMCDQKHALNLLHIARAAFFCEAYFTSIMYCELWSAEYELPKENVQYRNLRHILVECYRAISELDAANALLDPMVERGMHLEMSGSWNHLFLEYDAICFSQPSALKDFHTNLLRAGLYFSANTIQPDSHVSYECAWRLGDWSILCENQPCTGDGLLEFEKCHYNALKCLHNRDEDGIETAVRNGRIAVIEILRHTSLECTKNAYRYLQMLHQLQQIEDFAEIQLRKIPDATERIMAKWRHMDKIPFCDFKCKEVILAQRSIILKGAGTRVKRKLPDELANTYLWLVKEARQHGHMNIAIRYLSCLNALDLSDELKPKLIVEDAQINWQLGDKAFAKKLLHRVVSDKVFHQSLSRVVALRLYGEYLAESRSDSTLNIYETRFNGSKILLKNFSKCKERLMPRSNDPDWKNFEHFELNNQIKTYEAIAKYTDREYVQITSYKKSRVFECKQALVADLHRSLVELKRTQTDQDEKRTLIMLERNIKIDELEILNTEKERIRYLTLAIVNYIRKCTLDTSLSDQSIFRIISLWFANSTNPEIIQTLEQELSSIPSYKFLLVIPQMAARLNNRHKDAGNQIVLELLKRCSLEHPHHTVNQILAIANSYMDDLESKQAKKPESRVIGAQNLIAMLKKNSKLTKIIAQTEQMFNVLIELANKTIKPGSKVEMPLSPDNSLRKLNNLNLIQCPTVTIPVSLRCDYTTIISIQKYDSNVTMVGGINAPKKLVCLCSDGVKRPQLLKGKDDLRQDAVMQQVFDIVNSVLKNENHNRKMCIRTYKVVPLSQRSGILEWCVNTIPLGLYLIGPPRGNGGAHKKYRPQDLEPIKCREQMNQWDSLPNDQKLKLYLKMCENILPVFHHFFYEHYLNPGEWFERRLAYTYSLATNSMVGYILGLGDRHVQNILVDKSTAELVHIDFGIAFEQGKILPHPELVPFRLTRDLVSVLGVTGVNGIFKKCCLRTMEVLKNNETVITTILEVLLYDPLYAWTLTNQKRLRHQNVEIDIIDDGPTEERNKTAERAIFRVQAKLKGSEEGITGISTVEAQVDDLIQQATNPANLCRLFSGWQPYL